MSPQELMLVDVSGFVFRAYHALPPLTNAQGLPTQAVLGFANMLLRLLETEQPTHLALCYDKDSRVGRAAIDSNYKANRPPAPEDLSIQFEWVRKLGKAMRLASLEMPGWEADDVIATLTQKAKRAGWRVRIISSDKDLIQLLDEGVRLVDPVKNRDVTPQSVQEKFGIHPSQMLDFLSLAGDASDNVPKVPGIGPKTAANLLAQFGSVDVLLTRLNEIDKPKLRKSLEENVDGLRRAQALIRLRDNLPLNVELSELARTPWDESELHALLKTLEFSKLLQKFSAVQSPPPPASPLPAPSRPPEQERIDSIPDLIEADDEIRLERLSCLLQEAKEVACWVLEDFWGEAKLAFYVPGEAIYVLRLSELRAEEGARKKRARQIVEHFSRLELKRICHAGKKLWHALAAKGVALSSIGADSELYAYVLDSSLGAVPFHELCKRYLGIELPSTPTEVEQAQQAFWLYQLAHILEEKLKAQNLWALAEGMELPLLVLLARMEAQGIRADRQVLADVLVEVGGRCRQLQAAVWELSQTRFNLDSPQQLGKVLYEDLKLPVLKKKKTGPSTDYEVLEQLASKHPLPKMLLEYRNLSKLKNTYLEKLPQWIARDGRIHTHLHQTLVATGRLSSSEPNIQNIPIRNEWGKKIRAAFCTEPGWKLVSADYSQLELRILAHMSADAALLSAFLEGGDVHRRTAAEIFGVVEALISHEQRRAAKMVNYGIAYGLSARGLSLRLSIPQKEAADIVARYEKRFAGVFAFFGRVLSRGREVGYIETLFGRRRYLPELNAKNKNLAQAAERAAVNMPIQGTAADLMKRAMLTLDAEMRKRRLHSHMLLQVHDELLLECPEGEVEEVVQLAREHMSQAGALLIPLEVEVKTGENWAQIHD
ncbi:MAG: DNA polymerase I [Proteobacteria bacterium]|nr:DNA polymerase I [Cystobacterineae bacterium]MCL2259342.1 DNA polymerase I [Cystobacterineae bacterium]MCL2314204.1 DNA polymerase I [Pseudomonadota bacterium]